MGLATTMQIIDEEELRLGYVLPEIVKSILLDNNGGVECTDECSNEVWYLFSVKDTRSKKHLKRSSNHIEIETESARTWRGFPIDALAIGGNGTGDYLIIMKDSPSIYIWRHETSEIEKTTIKLVS